MVQIKCYTSIGLKNTPDRGSFYLAMDLVPYSFGHMSETGLEIARQFGWWLHVLVVLSFLVYLPYSKHLHILLAFPNTYFSPDKSRGIMVNMPEIEHEVKSMLGIEIAGAKVEMSPDMQFGAADVFHLTRHNLLSAYTCTECGRCTSVCPAHITGKSFLPEK